MECPSAKVCGYVVHYFYSAFSLWFVVIVILDYFSRECEQLKGLNEQKCCSGSTRPSPGRRPKS